MKNSFLILIFSLVTISCLNHHKKKEIPKTKDYENQNIVLKENFENFLTKFKSHKDFRESRINFPIRGFNSEAEILKNRSNYIWNKEEWEFYSYYDFAPNTPENISEKIIKLKSGTYIWSLYKESSGYEINYEFSCKDHNWYLKSYSYKNF